MANVHTIRPVRTLMGRCAFESDLLEDLTAVCAAEEIRLGRISAIGALRKARIGYYDQDSREYAFLDLDRHLEILTLNGNISIKDGQPMIHAHVTLGDDRGQAFGGHLAPGTTVFACEFVIDVFDGPLFERGPDEETGLPLWMM